MCKTCQLLSGEDFSKQTKSVSKLGSIFLSMWTNNLSGNSTIDQITTKLLMQNEKKSPVAHLRATLCQ